VSDVPGYILIQAEREPSQPRWYVDWCWTDAGRRLVWLTSDRAKARVFTNRKKAEVHAAWIARKRKLPPRFSAPQGVVQVKNTTFEIKDLV
jgi:hypothetical protein